MTRTPEPPPEPTAVAAVRILGARGERGEITLEDGTELTLSADDLLATGLSTGDPVDEQMRAVLGEAALVWNTREAALRLLSHRARARGELAGRLRKKGAPPGVVARVLDELEDCGYLDDAAFARAFVADRLRLRPRGRRVLVRELRQKGVSEEVAQGAVEVVFQETGASEPDLARELAQGWLKRQPARLREALVSRERSPEREKALRRYRGFMARRGIAGGAALEALDRVRGEG